jgi:Co/Zn/Cd efflux system component
VIKRFVAILGLVTSVVGIWTLSHGHAQELACSAYARQVGSAAPSLLCPKAVATYLIGVALTTGGLIIAGLIAYAVVKQIRGTGWMEKAPEIPTQHQRVIGTPLGSERTVTTSS